MHRISASASRVIVLIAGMFFGASGIWQNSAMAEVFRVDLSGTFTSGGGPGPIPPNTPFVGVFLVDTDADAVQTETLPGLTVTGYLDAAISGVSITAGGVTFTQANIQDRIAVAGHASVAVYFSDPLTSGATPGIQMFFQQQGASLAVGALGCGDACSFSNQLHFSGSRPFVDSRGIVTVHVTLLFAGTPGASNCKGKSVSALGMKYKGLSHAATELDFSDVAALQSAIQAFCGG